MHEVKKIFVFLITFALTISGLPTPQELSPVDFGSPTPQPIATDWEMIYETSNVVGTTNPSLTPKRHSYHPSRVSLYLTRPNLDLLGQDPLRFPDHSSSLYLLSNKTFDRLISAASPWSQILPQHTAPFSFTHRRHRMSMVHGFPSNSFLALFNFKNAFVVIEITVKSPQPTCNSVNLFKLPSGEFLTSSAPLPTMRRKIASFSSASKTPPKELAAKPLPKGGKQYSFCKFNHDPIQLAAHRDDRIFCPSQIWIQGLPNPTQAMETIAHIGEEMKVDISPDSIAQVVELFTALNRNVSNQKLPHYPPPPNASPRMIGSTSNSYTTVMNLRSVATFSVVPINGHVSTVTELVICLLPRPNRSTSRPL